MRTITTILAALCALMMQGAVTAEQILDKAIMEIESAPSMSVALKVKTNSRSEKGTLTMSKSKYALKTGDLSVWFNGKTQWVLDAGAKEVSISEPTVEEQVESNPFMLIKNYKKLFTSKIVSQDKNGYVIKLTARSKHATIPSATVTISKTTHYPTRLEATIGNGAKAQIAIEKMTKGKALATSAFEYNPKAHKGVTVNDLR